MYIGSIKSPIFDGEYVFPVSDFYLDLKEKSPDKWKKAVKVLVADLSKSNYLTPLKPKKLKVKKLKVKKQAGMIEPPPETFKEIVSWAQQQYSNHILWLMEKDGIHDEILERKCHSKDAIQPESILNKNKLFKLDNKDWKHSNLFKWDSNKHIQFIVKLEDNPNQSRGGYWLRNYTMILNLQIPTIENLSTKPYLFERFMWKIEQSILHELIHAVQTYISEDDSDLEIRPDEKDKEFGLPSEHIRSKRDPRGFGDGEPRLQHALRDIEFYPRISDQIYELKKYLKIFPESTTKTVIKAFIGASRKSKLPVSDFFVTLKEKAPDKWKKAVKVLVAQLYKDGYLKEE